MGIKTVPQPPYSPDLAPGVFWSFPKLRGRRYETIEEMKAAVTKVIDTRETKAGISGALKIIQCGTVKRKISYVSICQDVFVLSPSVSHSIKALTPSKRIKRPMYFL